MGRKGIRNRIKPKPILGFDPWDTDGIPFYGLRGQYLVEMVTDPWHPLLDSAMHSLTWMLTPDPPDALARTVHHTLSLIHGSKDPPPPRLNEVARFLDWKAHAVVRGNPLMVVLQLWLHGVTPTHAWLLAQPRSWSVVLDSRKVALLPKTPHATLVAAAEELVANPMYQIWALNRDLTTRGMVEFPRQGDFFSRIRRIAAIERMDTAPTLKQIERLMQDVDVMMAPKEVRSQGLAIKGLLQKVTPRIQPPGYALNRGPFPAHTLPGDDVIVVEPTPSAEREREWAMEVLGLDDDVFEIIRDSEKARYYRGIARTTLNSKPHTRKPLSDAEI